MKSRDFKKPILKHSVFPFQNCQSTVSEACLANDLVLPKFVPENACYAQVNIPENSSYVVIIKKHLICWVASRPHSS